MCGRAVAAAAMPAAGMAIRKNPRISQPGSAIPARMITRGIEMSITVPVARPPPASPSNSGTRIRGAKPSRKPRYPMSQTTASTPTATINPMASRRGVRSGSSCFLTDLIGWRRSSTLVLGGLGRTGVRIMWAMAI